MNGKKLLVVTAFTLMIVSFITPALAHVTLNPREAVPGYQTYDVRVPNEKTVPTIELRLVVPDGADITGILPIQGWKYSVKKENMEEHQDEEEAAGHAHEEESERITEITWTGGKINPGEYFVFPISVRYQGEPTTLVWKAYQLYSDGDIVAWDDTVEGQPAPKVAILNESRLDSLTNVLADVRGGQQDARNQLNAVFAENNSLEQKLNAVQWTAIIALLLAFASLLAGFKRKK